MKLIYTTMLLLLVTVPGLAREIEDFKPDKTVIYKGCRFGFTQYFMLISV